MINDLLSFLQDHQTIVTTVSTISAVFFVTSLIALPIIISRLPDNYFLGEHRLSTENRPPLSIIERVILIVKNILGIILVLIGVVMLVLPGQGLLTILIGFSLSNFPGKYKLERSIIRRPTIFNTLNWIRHKAGKNKLQLPT